MTNPEYGGFGPTGVYDVVTASEPLRAGGPLRSMVYAAELADGYTKGPPCAGLSSLSAEAVVERAWAGMLEHERPLLLIAGDAGRHWGHVTDVARLMIDRTTGKQMMFPDGAEWMGVIVEVDPASIRPHQARTFVHELGEESERLVIAVWAGGDTAEAIRWARVLYPPQPSAYPPIEMVLQQACPRCEAQPGEKCCKPDGTISFRQHPPRVAATNYKPPDRQPVPAIIIAFDDRVEKAAILRVYRLLERREPRRGRGVLLLPRRERLFASPSPSTGGR